MGSSTGSVGIPEARTDPDEAFAIDESDDADGPGGDT